MTEKQQEKNLMIINDHWEIVRLLYHKIMITFQVIKIPEARNTLLQTLYMQNWQT